MLVVRRARGRAPLEVVPAWVTMIDPWRQLVIVTLPRKEPWTRHARTASQAAARGGRGTRDASARLGLASLSVAALAWRVVPPVRRFAFWLGARTIYALAFVFWLYGTTVFVVSRLAVRLLLVAGRLSHRLGAWLVTLFRRVSFSSALHEARPFARRHERLLVWILTAVALAVVALGIADADAPGIAAGALLLLMALRLLVHIRFRRQSADRPRRTMTAYWKH